MAAALTLLVGCGGDDDSGGGNQASSGDAQASEATSLEDLGISAEDLDGLDLENLDAEDLEALGLDDVDPALLDDLLEQIGVSVEDLDGADISDGADDGGSTDESSDGGSSDDGSLGGSGGDPCSLGADEIAALVGSPASSEPSEANGRGQVCTWEGAPGQHGTPRTLTVTLWPGAEFYSEGDTYSDPGLVEDVTDLGDDGWINATAGHVMWVDGDLTVDVFVPMGGPSESELLGVAHAVADDLG